LRVPQKFFSYEKCSKKFLTKKSNLEKFGAKSNPHPKPSPKNDNFTEILEIKRISRIQKNFQGNFQAQKLFLLAQSNKLSTQFIFKLSKSEDFSGSGFPKICLE